MLRNEVRVSVVATYAPSTSSSCANPFVQSNRICAFVRSIRAESLPEIGRDERADDAQNCCEETLRLIPFPG